MEREEIVRAIFSASVATTGLVLVLLGFLVYAVQSLDVESTTRQTRNRYRWASYTALAVIIGSLWTTGIALLWMLSVSVYWLVIGMFVVVLAAVLLVAVLTVRLLTR